MQNTITLCLAADLVSAFPIPADQSLTFEARQQTRQFINFSLYSAQGSLLFSGKTK